MSFRHIPLRILVSVCASLAVLAVPTAVHAQQQMAPATELEKSFSALLSKRTHWINGQVKATPADVQDLDIIAKWYAYRITWLRDDDYKIEEHIRGFSTNFVNECLGPTNSKGNREFVKLMGKLLAHHFQKVFDLDFATNGKWQVNTALMLPALARLKQDEVDQMLIEVIKNNKYHDAIKVHAIEALRQFFPVKIVDENEDLRDARVIEKKKRDMERVKVLVDFIERKWPTPLDKGEEDAIHFLRREAIRTLAAARAPAVAALKGRNNKQGEAEGVVAYELMKVLLPVKLEPAPSLSEKCEAAIGLLNFNVSAMPNYDPSISLYLVGEFLREYAKAYADDWRNFGNKAGGKLKQPWIPWKLYSKRLKDGVSEMAKNLKENPGAAAIAAQLDHAARPIFDDMLAYRDVDLTTRQTLDGAVREMRPKTTRIFQNVNGPEIDVTKGLK